MLKRICTLSVIFAIGMWTSISMADSGNDIDTTDPSAGAYEVQPSVDLRFADNVSEVPDFQKHVSPLLGRLGCNGRACHGSFQGQGGFRLSLFGYDFDADYKAIHEEGTGRIDLNDPVESLILAKPTDADIHKGGLRFEDDSWQFRLISNWVKSGGTGKSELVKLERLEVIPSELVFETGKEQVDLKVIAHWADGVHEDVTPLSRFQSNDPAIASISETGHVAAGDRGDSHLVVFYDNAVQPVPVMRRWTVGSDASRSGAVNREFYGPIDSHVQNKLDKLGLVRSDVADDATFLRRVYLDITGTLPSSVEVREFLADKSPDKRPRAIDKLIDSPAYAAWWTTFFCDLTGNNTQALRDVGYTPSEAPSRMWYEWIRSRVEANMPYDELVAGIVTAKGRPEGQSYLEYCTEMSEMFRSDECDKFVQRDDMPLYWMRREFQGEDELANSFAHAFLGIQIQCAQCHKHPFDQWTQADFNGFSRFFSGVQMQRQRATTKEDRADAQKIAIDLGLDDKAMKGGMLQKMLREALQKGKTIPIRQMELTAPRVDPEKLSPEQKQTMKRVSQMQYKNGTLPNGKVVEFKGVADIREPLMEWLREKDNPYFARAIVNRIWSRYFGVGIVDPADDLNMANPASNAELLDWLAKSLVEHDYDLKWLHREIANSRTYQTSWEPNETNAGDLINFSHAVPRRIAAEAVVDAMVQASANGRDNSKFLTDLDDRAIAIPGTVLGRGNRGNASAGFALEIFGRSTRSTSCDCDRSIDTSLIQTVYLQNDRDVHFMLGRNDGWIGEVAKAENDLTNSGDAQTTIAGLEERIQRLTRVRARALEKNQKDQVEKLTARIRTFTGQLDAATRQVARASAASEHVTDQQSQKEAMIEEAYVRSLGRMPKPDEMKRCLGHMQDYQTVSEGLSGILWALVNSSEFIVNH